MERNTMSMSGLSSIANKNKAIAMKVKKKLQQLKSKKESKISENRDEIDDEEDSQKSKRPKRKTIKFTKSKTDRLGPDKDYLALLSSRISCRTDIYYDNVESTIKRDSNEMHDH